MNFTLASRRLYRGVVYFLRYLILERPKGLDISLRSKKHGITLPGNHGYALTSKSALKNMLRDIPLQDKSLLDVGSGKGGVVIYAYQLGCRNASGIEYEQFLHNIAAKNISILKLDPYCKSLNVDAREFQDYGSYDIFFMFNPFDYDIYEQVLKKMTSQILSSHKVNDRYLICYGDANIDAANESGLFHLIREGNCPYRGNIFRVFKTVYDAKPN